MKDTPNNRGLILWITGLPGVGKTELSDKISFILSESHDINVVQLDGDLLRLVLNYTQDSSTKERKTLGATYFRVATMIAQQGHIVVVSTVALYSEIFTLLKNSNLPVQIINLTCTKEIALSRNQAREINSIVNKPTLDLDKKISEQITFPEQTRHYANNLMNDLENISIEIVKLVLDYKSHYQKLPRESIRKHVINYKHIESFKKEYWDNYYISSLEPKPSTFAEFVSSNYLKPESRIIDYGCGNGRDSFLFSKNCATLGLDVSDTAILSNNKKAKESTGIKTLEFSLLNEIFTLDKYLESFSPDVFYARFVFHAFNELTENQILKSISQQLPLNGLFCAEMRTINDPLYKKGIKISKTERIYGHYRRFIDAREFIKKLEYLNFTVLFSEEDKGFSITDGDDPVLLRIIAQFKK